MTNLHEDYYIRKCFMERNEVPTQSEIMKKMGPALAKVYFKSMSPPVKVLAGLDPPLKGGGKDWYVPPMDLLKGKAVLKPVKRSVLSKLSCDGVLLYGDKIVMDHCQRLEAEKQKLLDESDLKWKEIIDKQCESEREVIASRAEEQNTTKIKEAFQEFTIMYRTSLTRIESILKDAGMKELQGVKDRANREMSINFETLLKQQSKFLHDSYKGKLETEKNKIKQRFIEDIEKSRTDWDKEVSKINFGKHVAIEKLRTLLEYQNLACQVYVALKERVECNKELSISKNKHEKAIKNISDKITIKDVKIKLAQEKEKKQNECNRAWHKKICLVVKRFQEFVKCCLNTMPDYADFFINMEKLMLLHLGDTLENPSAESIFAFDCEDNDQAPIRVPQQCYLVCDEGFNPQLDSNYWPKGCTCGQTQLPVVIVNKRCMYAACDKFEAFNDKVKEFVEGKRGNDEDFVDDHDYKHDVPIEYSLSDHFKELQLESSLMQILQTALPNIKRVSSRCAICNSYYCFCTPPVPETHTHIEERETPKYEPSGEKITLRTDELKHVREPKINSYLEFILGQTYCTRECTIFKKKRVDECLPAYMRNTSTFESVDLPDYETCSLHDLKLLVARSRNVKPEAAVLQEAESKMKDASTQYSEEECFNLCDCSDYDIQSRFKKLGGSKLDEEKSKPLSIFDKSLSSTHLAKQANSFALETALKLKKIIRDAPELEELFRKENCDSEN